jgi:hypothetical protein
MLNDGKVTSNTPACDARRARAFYADGLGLRPSADFDVASVQVCTTAGRTTFTIVS